MQPFEFQRVTKLSEAAAAGQEAGTAFVAGGTDLLFLMKNNVEQPSRLVDINALPLAGIEVTVSGTRIGALATLADVAAHPIIAEQYPPVRQAILAAASPQIRNMATVGGNLLQRTRCPYFRHGVAPCNKRLPHSGCSAIEGVNRWHAILGVSEHCIAAFASDLPVALLALDAAVELHGPGGPRRVPLEEFYRLPGDTPWIETSLQRGELITAVEIPPAPSHGCYLKARDRASFEVALASAAVALEVRNERMYGVRIALGGVAPVPWRARAVEEVLEGAIPDHATLEFAAETLTRHAVTHQDNGYKVALAQRVLMRAIALAAEERE